MASTFIGIDLAWRSDKNWSGGAVLSGDRRCARLLETPASLASFSEVLAYIEDHTTSNTVVAIDAPLVISNDKGQRPCETLIGRHYGARHASCHTSNSTLYPDAASVRLADKLVSSGFRHAPDLAQFENERVMLEVYPHPALLELFVLPRIIKYKKGKLASRRSGQQEVQRRLNELSLLAPALVSTSALSEYLAIDTNSLKGSALKMYEDGLDSIICAYVGYYYWFWGTNGTLQFGDIDSGYIIVPTLATKS